VLQLRQLPHRRLGHRLQWPCRPTKKAPPFRPSKRTSKLPQMPERFACPLASSRPTLPSRTCFPLRPSCLPAGRPSGGRGAALAYGRWSSRIFSAETSSNTESELLRAAASRRKARRFEHPTPHIPILHDCKLYTAVFQFCLDLGRAVSGEHPDVEAASIAAAGLGLSLSAEDDVAQLTRLGAITSLIRVIEMHVGTVGEDADEAVGSRGSISKLGERCLQSVMSCLDLLIERSPTLASYLAFTGRGCLLIDTLRVLLSADSSQVASICSVLVSIFASPATSTRRFQCRVDLCTYAFCSGLLASASKFVLARTQVLSAGDLAASAAVSGILSLMRGLVRSTIELPKGIRSSAWEAASAALDLSDLCSALPLMSTLILDPTVSNLPSAAPLAAKATVLLSDIAKLDPALVSRRLTAASSLLEFTHVGLRVLSLAVVPSGLQLLSFPQLSATAAVTVEPALLHSILDLLARFFIASGPDTHANIATAKVSRDGPPLLLALCQLHHRYTELSLPPHCFACPDLFFSFLPSGTT
jgi:hypothetical protein